MKQPQYKLRAQPVTKLNLPNLQIILSFDFKIVVVENNQRVDGSMYKCPYCV